MLLFKLYFIDYAIIVVSHFSPFYSPLPCTSLPSPFPHLSSCTWVIHMSSLASPFPMLFLTSPCLFYAYHLCFLFPVLFPPFSPLPLPTDNPPCDLHFCDSVLVVCLVFLVLRVFLDSVVHYCGCCHFTVHIFDHLLFLR